MQHLIIGHVFPLKIEYITTTTAGRPINTHCHTGYVCASSLYRNVNVMPQWDFSGSVSKTITKMIRACSYGGWLWNDFFFNWTVVTCQSSQMPYIILWFIFFFFQFLFKCIICCGTTWLLSIWFYAIAHFIRPNCIEWTHIP